MAREHEAKGEGGQGCKWKGEVGWESDSRRVRSVLPKRFGNRASCPQCASNVSRCPQCAALIMSRPVRIPGEIARVCSRPPRRAGGGVRRYYGHDKKNIWTDCGSGVFCI